MRGAKDSKDVVKETSEASSCRVIKMQPFKMSVIDFFEKSPTLNFREKVVVHNWT